MRKMVPIGDADLSVWDQGTGQTLVLIHGFPMDGRLWLDGPAIPNPDICRSIVPDMRGFGASRPSAESVPPALMADDVAGLLDALDIREPIVLAGLSMGGYVALEFHRRHGDRLAGLILCDTRAEADSPEMRDGRRHTAESVLDGGPEPLIDGMIEKLVSPATLAQRPDVVRQLRAMGVEQSRQSIASAALGMAQRVDMTEHLAEIHVPTLLIVGADDPLTPPALMADLAAAIGENARLVEIPQAGHVPPLEQPARVKTAIEDFLDTIT